MLLETALLGCFVYIVGTGKSVRAASRMVGYGVGRAAGSLRRVRAEVDSVQQRVAGVGGSELHTGRAEVAERMRRMRAIQLEAQALVSMYPRGAGMGGAAGPSAPPPPFSDEEITAATAGQAAGGSSSSEAAGRQAGQSVPLAPPAPLAASAAAAAPQPQQPAAVAYYFEGKPVIQASFEHVWDAGSSVPRGLTQQHIADAIRLGTDLANTDTSQPSKQPAAPGTPPPPRQHK